MAEQSWILTSETLPAVLRALEEDGVPARQLDGHSVGIRWWEHRHIARPGDTVTRRAPGAYRVERSGRRGVLQQHETPGRTYYTRKETS